MHNHDRTRNRDGATSNRVNPASRSVGHGNNPGTVAVRPGWSHEMLGAVPWRVGELHPARLPHQQSLTKVHIGAMAYMAVPALPRSSYSVAAHPGVGSKRRDSHSRSEWSRVGLGPGCRSETPGANADRHRWSDTSTGRQGGSGNVRHSLVELAGHGTQDPSWTATEVRLESYCGNSR